MLFPLSKSTCFIICIGIFFLLPCIGFAQKDSLLTSLEENQDTTVSLLPKRMMFTQSLLWGRKGALRITGLAPLTEKSRTRELKLRRRMLVLHQLLGYVTLGGMVAQGFVGQRLYNHYTPQIKNTHKMLATGVSITYFSTAALSLFAPPPMLRHVKERNSSIKWHKRLAFLHMAGMITTLVLADKASEPKYKPLHRAAAFTAFTAFTASMIVMTF